MFNVAPVNVNYYTIPYTLLMLQYFNVSTIYVALFDVSLFTVALSNVALCKYYTILCSTILIFHNLILDCFHVAFFNIRQFDISP